MRYRFILGVLCALSISVDAAPLALITNNLDRTVSVVNTETHQVEQTITVGSHPVGVAISPDASKAYISNSGAASLSVIDLASRVVTNTVSVGNNPGGISVSADGSQVYVTNRDDDTVSIVDTASTLVIATVSVGDSPRTVVPAVSGSLAYVSNFKDNTVSVIDTQSQALVSTIGVGSGPLGVALNPSGAEVYVANQLGNSVSVIDTSTQTVTRTLSAGARPSSLVVLPTLNQLYIANRDGNSVSVIDLATWASVYSIPVGSGPHGIGATEDGAEVYVANYFGDSVSVISTADHVVTSTIPVGNGPFALGKFIVPDTPAVVSEGPNIIFILTDDMNVGDAQYMPNLQSMLAAQGVTFTNAFVTSTSCCPSRASMLRGQYPHNTSIHRTGDAFDIFTSLGYDQETVATHLQASGYRTAFYGKYFNDYSGKDAREYIPPGWTEWYALLLKGYYQYNMNVNGAFLSYGIDPEDYQTDVLAGFALESVKALATDPRPLFQWIAVSAPHLPSTPADRHLLEFQDLTSPRTESFNEPDVSDKPQWIKDLAIFSTEDEVTIDTIYRDRLRSLLAVDDMIGSLVAELESLGELNNTYFVFSSDHGFQLGEHRLEYGKGTAYEESIRVPLVIRGPGVPAGETREHLVINNDFMPTMVDMGAGYIPALADGRSLMPLLSTTPTAISNWRQRFLVQKTMDPLVIPKEYLPDNYYAVRDKYRLYTEYYESDEKELYDMRSDPYQVRSKHKSVSSTLLDTYAAQLQSLIGCQQQACRDAEGAP